MNLLGNILLILLILISQENSSIKKHMQKDDSPIEVRARHLKIENQKRRATFSENVVATKADMVMTCNILVAFYNESGNIEMFECTGDVHLTIKEKQATSQKAVFDNLKEMITMTGSPYYTDGENQFWGEVVEYDIANDEVNVRHIRAVVKVKNEKKREEK